MRIKKKNITEGKLWEQAKAEIENKFWFDLRTEREVKYFVTQKISQAFKAGKKIQKNLYANY